MLETKHCRAIRKINQSIKSLDLDLSGLVVLTEVGSNNYLYTPLIAALAGAHHVFAWTGDTRYGEGNKIKENCLALAEKLGIENRITVTVNKKNIEHINSANVITNSGFIRPIDATFLKYVDPNKCVIPLMYEAWELRSTDIDINVCYQRSIRVAGTWENHPKIAVFEGVGPLAIKLSMEAGYEVYQNNIIVWSSDEFGDMAKTYFEKIEAKSVTITTDTEHLYHLAPTADFIFFCDYNETKCLVGEGGLIDVDKLGRLNPALGYVQLYGDIDDRYLENRGRIIFPAKRGKPRVMTESLAYLGEQPVINLQVAGFKVAECLSKGIQHDLVQPISGI
ncbi:MAG: hypothetical protein KUG82_03965 [Pseudomonadales bacterium]|nr:hypothetical protein [Pseudomonadales bacterium]